MNQWKRSRSQGFSLLEMVIALFIVSLLFGMAIMATRQFFGDEELRSASQKLALLAKTARQAALRENRPYEIMVEADRLTLHPVQNESEKGEAGSEFDPLSEQKHQAEELVLPSSVKLKIKVWGSEDWVKPKRSAWRFTASGLCAPDSFRLERGESWIQMTFNPLTANRQEQEWYLP
jgi:prepilin-type N-terminal cleavage/methylation domain-containing protein